MNNPKSIDNQVLFAELRRSGGSWLASMRVAIQERGGPKGSTVTWGSNETVTMTVDDLEYAAARVATAAINEHLEKLKREHGRTNWEHQVGTVGWLHHHTAMIDPKMPLYGVSFNWMGGRITQCMVSELEGTPGSVFKLMGNKD